MALIAHWPLNGDILDYSGNGLHLTNNGATINNEGKIGKCYEFLNVNQYLDTEIQNQIDSNNFCISFWVYIKEQNCQKYIFGNNLGDNQRLAFSLFDNYFSLSYGNIAWGNKIFNYELNKWYNIIINCKEDLKIFINNELKYSTKSQKFLFPSFLKIGGRKDTINSPLIKINDFKIFNQELSKKEIKELYQTKILDWKFNECEEPTINLLYSNKQTFFNNFVDYENTTDKYKVECVKEVDSFNSKVMKLTVTADKDNDGKWNSGYLNGIQGYENGKKIDLIPGKKYTLTYRYKTKNYTKGYIAIWSHSRRLDGTTYSNDITGLPDTKGEWQIFKFNFTCPNDVNGRHFAPASIRHNNEGFEYYVDWMQLEEKEYATEYTPNERKGKIIDSSGYKNYGLIELNSSPKWLSNNEYEFDGINDFIKSNGYNLKNLFNNNNFTIEVICKFNELNKSDLFLNIGSQSSTNKQLHIGKRENNKLTFAFWGNDLDSVDYLKINEYYHFVFSNLNGLKKIYINGIENSRQNGSLLSLENQELFVGKRSVVDNFSNFNLKKLKIYANVLSDSDIKELYENQLTIDKNNNINCNEIIENKNLINLKLFTLTDLRINGGTYKKNYNLNTYQVINPGVESTFRMNFNYDFIKQFENKEFIFSFRYKLINGTDKNFIPSDINDGDFLFRKKIENQFILKCIRPTYTDIYRFIDFILDANTEIEMYDFQMYLVSDYKNNEFINKQGNLYKDINEIDYIDTVKINKNNEILCNTISEV